ncbi:L,D-transpeptidase family protein [Alteribacter aurantiacus]|uniref:L,D-transpeptidase family protein n=1 Tax=Alteribacter aurantiacus TaxID=254410 RepID=UPI00041A51F5|nr:L,D-transpeptidase family protein [Alteribacter aurantiacus]
MSITNQIIETMGISKETNHLIMAIHEGEGHATVHYWSNAKGSWERKMQVDGFLGSGGTTDPDKKQEGDKKSPLGIYKVSTPFGTEDPGTNHPFTNITPRSYWISNPLDVHYNTWQERDHSHKDDEHLISLKDEYKYAMVIEYNTDQCVKGKGSAIFLHISNGTPTLGCVSVPEAQMRMLMQELDEPAYVIIANSESDLINY